MLNGHCTYCNTDPPCRSWRRILSLARTRCLVPWPGVSPAPDWCPHATAQAVVAPAGEALAPQKARVARTLVRHVLAFGVDALDEELERAHVVAGDQDARGLLETLLYQGERQRRRRLAQIRAAGLFLAVVRVKIQMPARLTHPVSWKALSCTTLVWKTRPTMGNARKLHLSEDLSKDWLTNINI